MSQTWNEARYVGDAGPEPEGRFQPALMAPILRSPLFSCYLDMLIPLNHISKDFGGWCEGCYCHEDLLVGELPPPRKRLRRLLDESSPRCLDLFAAIASSLPSASSNSRRHYLTCSIQTQCFHVTWIFSAGNCSYVCVWTMSGCVCACACVCVCGRVWMWVCMCL